MTTFPAHAVPEHAPQLRRVSDRRSLTSFLNPVTMTTDLWRLRGLIGQFALRSISERNRGSHLGLLWTVLQPLLMLAVYTFVFAVVWQAKWGAAESPHGTASFAITVFAGLLLFEVFGASAGQAPTTIVNNPNYVKKVVFPLEVLPIASVLVSTLLAGVSVGVLLLGKLLTGTEWLGGADARVSSTLHLFPLVLPAVMSLSAGVALGLAALGVFLRDIRPLVQGMLLQVLFFMTPIFYPIERVPEAFRAVLAWNPLAVIVESGRRTLVNGQTPDWVALGAVTLIGLVSLQMGYAVFMKAKRGFADVL